MRRRDFITAVAGSAVTWPLAARAQQSDQLRRIGFLSPIAENDPEVQTWVGEFTQRLQELGWADGRTFALGAPTPCAFRRKQPSWLKSILT